MSDLGTVGQSGNLTSPAVKTLSTVAGGGAGRGRTVGLGALKGYLSALGSATAGNPPGIGVFAVPALSCTHAMLGKFYGSALALVAAGNPAAVSVVAGNVFSCMSAGHPAGTFIFVGNKTEACVSPAVPSAVINAFLSIAGEFASAVSRNTFIGQFAEHGPTEGQPAEVTTEQVASLRGRAIVLAPDAGGRAVRGAGPLYTLSAALAVVGDSSVLGGLVDGTPPTVGTPIATAYLALAFNVGDVLRSPLMFDFTVLGPSVGEFVPLQLQWDVADAFPPLILFFDVVDPILENLYSGPDSDIQRPVIAVS